MQTKPLLYGIIGFMLGGLIVSIAATTFEKPKEQSMDMAALLQGKTGDDFDEAFIAGMISHHQDAIDMAKMADKQAGHQQVKELSKNIINAQQREIDEMKRWQIDWGYSGSTGASKTEHAPH